MKTENNNINTYLNGRREWLERYGDYISRASQWRIIAVITLIIALVSISGNIIQIKQNKVIPYIIQVDSLGNSKNIGRANMVAVSVPKELIQAELAAFINNWRSVTADLDLQKRLTNKLSYFVTGSAQGQLNEWYANNNPYKTAENGRLIQIEVKNLPLPVSSDSWRVEWTETVRNHVGTFMQATTYEATLKINIKAPNSDEKIMQNPGGILINEIYFSKVLNAENSSAITPNIKTD